MADEKKQIQPTRGQHKDTALTGERLEDTEPSANQPITQFELDDLLDTTPDPLERDTDDDKWLNDGQPSHKPAKNLALSDIQANSNDLVRVADIDQLPQKLRKQFWDWMRGQTMPLIDGESWVYPHDWQRFLRWHATQANRQPGSCAGRIQIRDDFDEPL